MRFFGEANSDVPKEIFNQMLSYFDDETLFTIGKVCKIWNQYRDEFYKKKFPELVSYKDSSNKQLSLNEAVLLTYYLKNIKLVEDTILKHVLWFDDEHGTYDKLLNSFIPSEIYRSIHLVNILFDFLFAHQGSYICLYDPQGKIILIFCKGQKRQLKDFIIKVSATKVELEDINSGKIFQKFEDILVEYQLNIDSNASFDVELSKNWPTNQAKLHYWVPAMTYLNQKISVLRGQNPITSHVVGNIQFSLINCYSNNNLYELTKSSYTMNGQRQIDYRAISPESYTENMADSQLENTLLALREIEIDFNTFQGNYGLWQQLEQLGLRLFSRKSNNVNTLLTLRFTSLEALQDLQNNSILTNIRKNIENKLDNSQEKNQSTRCVIS